MTTTWAGVILVGTIVLALAVVYRPFGDYLARVLTTTHHLRAERVIYRLGGIDPDAERGGAAVCDRCWPSARCRSFSCTRCCAYSTIRSPLCGPANDQ